MVNCEIGRVDSLDFFLYYISYKSGYSSVVERDLAKVDVARSNRVTRLKTNIIFFPIHFLKKQISYPFFIL